MAMTFETKIIPNKAINNMYTGTGTAGTEGSASVAYVPSLWTFNAGITPAAGDIITIKIPVAGNESGVWLSVDNGTTYYPVATNGDKRLTTQYPVNHTLMMIFETGLSTKLYGNTKDGAPAGSALTSYSINRWRVMNYCDSNGEIASASEIDALFD